MSKSKVSKSQSKVIVLGSTGGSIIEAINLAKQIADSKEPVIAVIDTDIIKPSFIKNEIR